MALFDSMNSGVYGKAGPAVGFFTCPVCSNFKCLGQQAILAKVLSMCISHLEGDQYE